jgi:peptidylamidoglycolate lyase
VSIRNGDWLRATCQFNSSLTDVETPVGHGATNEMCNLYLMVHAELPYFSWCAMPEGEMIVDPIGAGGLPAKGTANIETAHWRTLNYFEHNSIEVPVKQVSGLANVVGQYDDPAVWVFHRGDRIWNGTTFDARTHVMADAPLTTPSLLQVHRDSGALVDGSEFGLPSATFPGFLMPHFVSSSLDGTAVWVVDAGTHQVYRFDASGAADRAPTLTIGARGVAGDESTNAAAGASELDAASVRFCQPTHAIESRDGRLFVSDGYCHSRIVVLDLATKKVSAVWPLSTAAGKAPLPHALLVGECERKLYVADREAARIVVMDLETGKESASWNLEAHGLPYVFFYVFTVSINVCFDCFRMQLFHPCWSVWRRFGVGVGSRPQWQERFVIAGPVQRRDAVCL